MRNFAFNSLFFRVKKQEVAVSKDFLEYDTSIFNSRLSFQPLLNALKKNINEGKSGAKKLYGGDPGFPVGSEA